MLAADNDVDLVGNGLKRCEHIFSFRHWCFFPAKALEQSRRHTWYKDPLRIHLQSWAENNPASLPFPTLQISSPQDFCRARVQLGLQILNESLVHACSEQGSTTQGIKSWLLLNPCSWSGASAAGGRSEEEKKPKACTGRS